MPLDETTGFPRCYSYLARSEEEIRGHMKMKDAKQAKLLYLILAQPIDLNYTPFPVMTYGTNNEFMARDVTNRITNMVLELKENGIEVLGLSSDGDSRLLSSMKYLTKLGNENDQISENEDRILHEPYYNSDSWDIIFLQDFIPKVLKCRNRLLKRYVNSFQIEKRL